MRGDDRVGLAVAEELERLLREDPIEGVIVRTGERAGFEIIDLLAGADRAVIVDCLDVPSPRPGRVRVLAAADVSGSARLVGGHDISFGAALELARLLGIGMPAHVTIVGIEAADTTRLGEDLSPGVADAVLRVAAWLHRELRFGLWGAQGWLAERATRDGALA